DQQVVGAVHRHAPAGGVVNRGVLDVLAGPIAVDVPVDRVAGERPVLSHAIELDARDLHLGAHHRHDVPAKVGLVGIFRRLDADVAGEQADFAALVHAEGDLAEVHVLERLVESERVARDGGNLAPLGLAGVEVGRGEHDLVTHAPAGRVEHLNPVAALLGGLRQFGPGILAVAVQAQRSPHHHDPAIAHGVDVLALDLVGQGDRGLARVGPRFRANLQFTPAQIDPVGL